jgi:ABC-2 type transport system permease protein
MQVDESGTAIPGTIRNVYAIGKSALILIGHIIGFVGGAIFIFRRKDLLN